MTQSIGLVLAVRNHNIIKHNRSNKSNTNASSKVSSNAKKDCEKLVAKCTEPKPGKTRYWTKEENLRFLVL